MFSFLLAAVTVTTSSYCVATSLTLCLRMGDDEVDSLALTDIIPTLSVSSISILCIGITGGGDSGLLTVFGREIVCMSTEMGSFPEKYIFVFYKIVYFLNYPTRKF